MTNKREKATKQVLEHVDRAQKVLSDFHNDAVNADGLLMAPSVSGCSAEGGARGACQSDRDGQCYDRQSAPDAPAGTRRPLVLEDANGPRRCGSTGLCDLPLQLEGTLSAARSQAASPRTPGAQHRCAATCLVVGGVLQPGWRPWVRHSLLSRTYSVLCAWSVVKCWRSRERARPKSRRIFRQEAGHAIDEAYGLHNRERYRGAVR